MSKSVQNFYKNISGKANKVKDIIPTMSSLGDLKQVSDFDVIINSWKNILTTPIGSYDHDPTYGSELYNLIYEPVDKDTVERIKDEVETKLMLYDDRAYIKSIDVIFFKKSKKGFTVSIDMAYKGETKNVRANLTELGVA